MLDVRIVAPHAWHVLAMARRASVTARATRRVMGKSCCEASVPIDVPPTIGYGRKTAEGLPQRGIFTAWDPVAQKERWFAPGGGSNGGGALATGGNLVFQVLNDGRLMAYSADKGEKMLDL